MDENEIMREIVDEQERTINRLKQESVTWRVKYLDQVDALANEKATIRKLEDDLRVARASRDKWHEEYNTLVDQYNEMKSIAEKAIYDH